MPQNVTILVDMDEVLVDFTDGACKAHGITRQELEEMRTPGNWCMAETMGITVPELWKPISQLGPQFWLQLSALPWAPEVLCLLDSLGPRFEWHIVSSPTDCPTSYDGKVRWLKNYFGVDFDRFVLTPHKHILANPRSILIDDKAKNVCAFRDVGGLAVLFPSHGNQLHALAETPIQYMKTELSVILQKLRW